MRNKKEDIDRFIDKLFPMEEQIRKTKKRDRKLRKYYGKELEDYNIVTTLEELRNLKKGGYIKYVNEKNELKFGGYLQDIIKEKDNTIIITRYHKNLYWSYNTIYYRNHVSRSDKMRNFFIKVIKLNEDSDDE